MTAAAAAALVPLPLVPRSAGPIRRPAFRRGGPHVRARAQTDAPDPGPQRLLPAAPLPPRTALHPAGSAVRLFAPETLP